MHYFSLKTHRKLLAAELCPDPLDELTAIPRPLAGFTGYYQWQAKGEAKRQEGRGRRGRGERGRRGRTGGEGEKVT